MIRRNRSTLVDRVKLGQQIRSQRQKEFDDVKKKIDKIQNNINTEVIKYPEYKESYDYVDNLFPHIGVKTVSLFKANHKLLNKLGFGSAGGFYNNIYKTVIISDKFSKNKQCNKCAIEAKLTRDEVIVHELIHYCYFAEQKTGSMHMNEEYAYGYSIGYLRQKGYSDDNIIKNNFLPYLVSSVRDKIFRSVLLENGIKMTDYNLFTTKKKMRIFKKYNKKVYDESLKQAIERGKKIIEIYNKKLNSENKNFTIEEEEKEENRFEIIDMD
jgi:hypothetical protein